MVNLWNQTVKVVEKLGRDTNEILKESYKTIASNVEAEARRVRDRLGESETQSQIGESNEVPVLNEEKRKLLELRETVNKIKDSLQNINTLCNPMVGEPHVNPGAHTADIADLNSNQERMRNQIDAFRHLVADRNEEFALQLNFLSQMDCILQGRTLRTICFELENVVDRGDSETVKRFGEMAGGLFQQIERVMAELDQNTRNPNVEIDVIPSELPNDNNTPNVWS
ncbi:hypothetical protein CAEBREN_04241 [Caenorhabditis brenneri]|uniref:Uncharacterized protein n=1 Tax=Caenorhabditis brenneri TaxID=135651 RepID=G0MP19_CAEBE|nr:hypothetical protein CAEBREN_04241 [Caenorhabditis brenneri]